MSSHNREHWKFPPIYVGAIAERATVQILRKKGFSVWRPKGHGQYFVILSGAYGEKWKTLFAILGDKKRQFFEYMERDVFRPDIVARKGGKVYLGEIKANGAQFTHREVEGLPQAREYGFIPVLARLNVSVEMADATITTLAGGSVNTIAIELAENRNHGRRLNPLKGLSFPKKVEEGVGKFGVSRILQRIGYKVGWIHKGAEPLHDSAQDLAEQKNFYKSLHNDKEAKQFYRRLFLNIDTDKDLENPKSAICKLFGEWRQNSIKRYKEHEENLATYASREKLTDTIECVIASSNYFDFMAKKGGESYFVKARINPKRGLQDENRQDYFSIVEKHGFLPMFVDLGIVIEVADFRIEHM